MASGDTTLSIAIEGGVTKTVVLPAAIKDLSKSFKNRDVGYTDVEWQLTILNEMGDSIVNEANRQQSDVAVASLVAKTFTAAT